MDDRRQPSGATTVAALEVAWWPIETNGDQPHSLVSYVIHAQAFKYPTVVTRSIV